VTRARAIVLVVATLGTGTLVACGRPTTAADRVRDALERTRAMSRHFTYTTETGGRTVTVQGIVEDDLRFQSTVSVGSAVIVDQVVRDDAVADRFDDAQAMSQFLRSAASPAGGSSQTAAATPSTARDVTLAALAAGRWVIDPHGAPSVAPPPPGASAFDPSLEAMQVFDYTEAALREAGEVVKFNPEDVSYKPKLDPFPRPTRDVVRYDVRPAVFPRAGGSLNQVMPDVRNFRKMAIYVRGGIVEAVRESMDVRSKLPDFVRIYGAKLPAHASPDQQAAFAIETTNSIRKGQGQQPIILRSMSFEVTDVGAQVAVALPADTVPGDLSVLADLGNRVRTTLG
jgi:hypothetical protein